MPLWGKGIVYLSQSERNGRALHVPIFDVPWFTVALCLVRSSKKLRDEAICKVEELI